MILTVIAALVGGFLGYCIGWPSGYRLGEAAGKKEILDKVNNKLRENGAEGVLEIADGPYPETMDKVEEDMQRVAL